MSVKLVFKIIAIMLLIFLIGNVFLDLIGSELDLNYTDLFSEIEALEPLNPYQLNWKMPEGITEDWGAFNFLKSWINGVWDIIKIPLFTSELLINAILYVFEVVRVLSVGVMG